MELDPKKLREMTNQAIERGRKEAEKTALLRRKIREQQEDADRRQAEILIRQLPQKAEKAASESRDGVMVMKFEDYTVSAARYPIEKLRGVPELVYDKCKEMDFKVVVHGCHDGVGLKSWFEIWIYW